MRITATHPKRAIRTKLLVRDQKRFRRWRPNRPPKPIRSADRAPTPGATDPIPKSEDRAPRAVGKSASSTTPPEKAKRGKISLPRSRRAHPPRRYKGAAGAERPSRSRPRNTDMGRRNPHARRSRRNSPRDSPRRSNVD